MYWKTFISLILLLGISSGCVSYDLRQDLEKSPAASRRDSQEYKMQKENLDRAEAEGIKIRGSPLEFDGNLKKMDQPPQKDSHYRVNISCHPAGLKNAIPIKNKQILWSILDDDQVIASGKNSTDENGEFRLDLTSFEGKKIQLNLNKNSIVVDIIQKPLIQVTSSCLSP